jgi:uncharacterized protein (UPF0332 family)
MNPAAFIEFAESVANDRRDAAACRSVISRAYYGAFHLAVGLLSELGLSVEHNHGHLRHDFLNSSNSKAHYIGQTLEELGAIRVEADYRLLKARTDDPKLAQDCIASAKKIGEVIQQLRSDLQNAEARQAFVDAIASHRKKVGRRT